MRYISNPRSLNCGRDKEIYDDLYEFADRWCYTTKWTKADVDNKLNRTKRMYGINDTELNKVLAKVNKDFTRKKSAKTNPYSDAAYKTDINSSRHNLNASISRTDEILADYKLAIAKDVVQATNQLIKQYWDDIARADVNGEIQLSATGDSELLKHDRAIEFAENNLAEAIFNFVVEAATNSQK